MAESDTLPQDDAARKKARPVLRKFEAMKANHEEDAKEKRESMRHTDHLTTERHASLSDLTEKHRNAVKNPASVSDEYRHTDHLTTERHASFSALKEKHRDHVKSAVGPTDEEIKARLSKKREKPNLTVLVCGDDKGELRNALRPEPEGEDDERKAKGAITEYRAKQTINGKSLTLLDAPGFGGEDIPPIRAIALIEDRLTGGDGNCLPLDGVVVITPSEDARVKLDAQVVATLVEKGFVGERKYDNIILAGTKQHDEADENKIFHDDVAKALFKPNGDCAELTDAISKLTESQLKYQPVSPKELADDYAEKFGLQHERFQVGCTCTRSLRRPY